MPTLGFLETGMPAFHSLNDPFPSRGIFSYFQEASPGWIAVTYLRAARNEGWHDLYPRVCCGTIIAGLRSVRGFIWG